MSWEVFYGSALQSIWALAVPPALFALWLLVGPRPRGDGAEPRAARAVRWWALVFALESVADATLPTVAGAPMLPFVLLGDFRVFLLVELVAAPERPLAASALVAAAWTLVVPGAAYATHALLTTLRGAQPETVLWLVYEVFFVALALWLRDVLVPRRRPPALAYLRAVLAYVAGYYVLWAAADVLVLAGSDLGWALRIVPNQLYYSLWVPFALYAFFAPPYAATSTAVHASR